MEFIKKAELFFIQLQYCLTIEPEPILQAEKGVYSLMLKPDIFFKLINDFNIDYPFIPENKIIELKGLMSKENINTKDALKIIENYKKQYWFLDTVVMFEPVTDKLKRTLKSIDVNISEKEINIELINYQKHLQAKRESIYIDLINEMQSLPPQPIVKQKPKLTINQIALKYVYELLQITRENGKEIARKYGHNSGEKLFQRFTYYSSTANRKGKPIPCTPKKLDNKIKLIESVIELLPTDKQERAKDEVSILKEIYEAEYQ